MPDLRIHEAGVQHKPLAPRLRIHEAGVDSIPEPLTPTLRMHDAGVTLGLPPVGPGVVWVRVAGAWVKHIRWVRIGGQWVTSAATGTTNPGDLWPSVDMVGPRQDPSTYPVVGDITTTANGQVIERMRCTGMIRIQHSNVIVRDVYMNRGPTADQQYWIRTEGSVGNILIEHVEIDAPPLANGIRTIAMNLPGVTSAGVTIKNCYIHGVGSGPRFYNNCHISDSIVEANFYAGSTSHRSGIGNNGGANCSIRRCRIECKGTLSSAAISLYGDNAVCSNHVFEDNLLVAADGFIAYGGSTPGKPFPTGNNVAYRRNRFRFDAPYSGPLYGAIHDFTPGVNGCVSEGNTWATAATLDDGTVVNVGDPI